LKTSILLQEAGDLEQTKQELASEIVALRQEIQAEEIKEKAIGDRVAHLEVEKAKKLNSKARQ
jgi:hypothetical protein